MYYSPVRHSTQELPPFRVRLACVRHAASVQSEPGSNSSVQSIFNRKTIVAISAARATLKATHSKSLQGLTCLTYYTDLV